MTISAKPDLSRPVHLLASGFGSGLAPRAPGTAGTLAAVPVYLLLQPLSPIAYLLLLVLLFGLGVWACGRVAAELGVHDHGAIVWDEWVGFLFALWLAPPGWGWLLGGFVLFRLFDIFKPWPIGWLDRRLSGGFGIMADDLAAGLFAFLLLQLATLWL